MTSPLDPSFSLPEYIQSKFPLTPVPSVPEIVIHKAGPQSGLWRLAEREGGNLPSPYWSGWWGGGVGLARHVLDHPSLVAGKAVLDLGTGSGLVAIAAAKAVARGVLAADIDRYAVIAASLNAKANGVRISVQLADLTDSDPPEVDVVLVGDLFYDADLAARVTPFLARCRANGADILVGDPGRRHLPLSRLLLLAAYPGPDFGAAGRSDSSNRVYSFA